LTLNTKRMRELQGPNTSIGAIMNLTFPLHH
jgi:hypothetical protein